MSIKELLKETKHRPWEMPKEDWAFYQEWNNAVFLHYQVEISELQKYVPTDLEIDTFEEQAWVSVVAFTMERIRPKYLPSFPPISNFDEINIRTYVRYKGKQGVYFLNIEGGKKLSCFLAKLISALPYQYSMMSRGKDVFKSKNNDLESHFLLKYSLKKDKVEKSDLDIWLTERYALFQDSGNQLNAYEIHHAEWPLQEVETKELVADYPKFKDLLPDQPALTHYSRGVEVIAWSKKMYSL
ncbi:DUF2071 domain-containing protein [Flammeovirga yaeyamensis]|uniref:DUF2071 domain-containing protein n=1 Tax=Flammeovirga yaeyamensis TaxID=367791 RepID=A0AAX1NCE3_9BACT|nr:DUF2071 domain-containing protein [Flammeovirga yaeyamensis]MBB3697936.1 hypothetical protein [Flammeovirga yaeyamensis]NMF35709.1 DUF2071 domain-containing protein [Flammeovirga yaeyamensis]QWG03338.1 DUF2071 domain-containing protein [Flammeovirga yaeyamensis]